MVVREEGRLDATFQALAHPARRAMLGMLAEGPHSVSELAAPFDVSLAASSKHLQVLERAGLVEREVVGREHRCRLVPEPLEEAEEWSESCRAVWRANFRRLDGVLKELKQSSQRSGTSRRKRKPKP